MARLWQTFQECGWPAYAIVFFSIVSVVAGVVALALAALRFRYATVTSAIALALAAGAAALGPVGTLVQRRTIDDVLAGESIDPSQRARIREAGYAEAAQCTSIGLGAGALPLLLAAGAVVLALARREGPSEG